jgi:hypothetical protein
MIMRKNYFQFSLFVNVTRCISAILNWVTLDLVHHINLSSYPGRGSWSRQCDWCDLVQYCAMMIDVTIKTKNNFFHEIISEIKFLKGLK